MNELLREMAGWTGYLERPAVVLQLLVVLGALLLYGLAGRSGLLLPWKAERRRLVLLATLGLVTATLAVLGQPWRLVLVLLVLIAGWFGLGVLRQALSRILPAQQLQQLDTGLLRPLFLLAGLLVLIDQLDNPQELGLISLGEWFGAEVTLGNALASLVVIYLLAVGAGPPAQALAWLVQRLIGTSEPARRAMALVFRYLAVAIGVLWTLDQIGFNRTAILAVAGGLSVGLGFGVKEVFSNFISGLWLLFEGSVRPGDVLFIDGDPCEVRSSGLRAAVLWRDRDNAELVIPNQSFFTDTTVTYTGSDRLRRSQILVGAHYRHDPAGVIALLEATARSHPRVLGAPPPKALLLSYGDSSINYALRFWIPDPMMNVSICSEVQVAVWQAFKAHGIEIPFPQRVLSRARPDP
ncbi:MAG: mechanosensitive ion channel domain-containing protein [Synechococcaceae cyanobacterium]|nr:mechanosensitive ion channel domain-containing protein [Synechococcaceae cyanobacterium]